MYSYEDRVRAVELYIKLGKRIAATIRQLGYPTKNSLGFVAVRLKDRARSIREVLLMLRVRRIDQLRTDGFLEHISSVLWRSCA